MKDYSKVAIIGVGSLRSNLIDILDKKLIIAKNVFIAHKLSHHRKIKSLSTFKLENPNIIKECKAKVNCKKGHIYIDGKCKCGKNLG